MSVGTELGALRALLHCRPSKRVWSALVRVLRETSEGMSLRYAEEHLKSWPDGLRKVPEGALFDPKSYGGVLGLCRTMDLCDLVRSQWERVCWALLPLEKLTRLRVVEHAEMYGVPYEFSEAMLSVLARCGSLQRLVLVRRRARAAMEISLHTLSSKHMTHLDVEGYSLGVGKFDGVECLPEHVRASLRILRVSRCILGDSVRDEMYQCSNLTHMHMPDVGLPERVETHPRMLQADLLRFDSLCAESSQTRKKGEPQDVVNPAVPALLSEVRRLDLAISAWENTDLLARSKPYWSMLAGLRLKHLSVHLNAFPVQTPCLRAMCSVSWPNLRMLELRTIAYRPPEEVVDIFSVHAPGLRRLSLCDNAWYWRFAHSEEQAPERCVRGGLLEESSFRESLEFLWFGSMSVDLAWCLRSDVILPNLSHVRISRARVWRDFVGLLSEWKGLSSVKVLDVRDIHWDIESVERLFQSPNAAAGLCVRYGGGVMRKSHP